jgi:hypothetical protein
MLRVLLGATIVGRRLRLNRFVLPIALLFGCLIFPASAVPEFDFSGWSRSKDIQIPPHIQEGIVGVALDSSVLERCKQDLGDVRIVESDGKLVPVWITPPVEAEEPPPFQTRPFRVSKKPGKWTELWIDKGAKVLTREVLLETSSKDFMRKVELRGSDNGKDAYVILMDGLVMDLEKPLRIRSLEIPHHLNNFQYLQIRILDDEQPPLKIENVSCRPPGSGLKWPLNVRVMENRVVPSTNTTVTIADLGERRFPVTGLKVSTESKQFAKTATILGGNNESPESWIKLHEGPFFRMRKEEAAKERLSAIFQPQLCRYIKVEMSGPGAPVTVNDLEAYAAVRIAVFDYRKGSSYRLYYENPQAKGNETAALSHNLNVATIASIAQEIKLGQEQKVVPAISPKTEAPPEENQSFSFRQIAGIALLLFGLLLLFGIMLKARSARRMNVHVGNRTFSTRL